MAVTAVVAFVLCCLVLRRRIPLLAALATMLARLISMGRRRRTRGRLRPIAVLAWTSLGRRSRVATWRGSATCVAAWHRVPWYVGCCTG